MFCKYCGNPFSGDKCPLCGKPVTLVNRTTLLDRLMHAAPPQEPPAPAPAPAPVPAPAPAPAPQPGTAPRPPQPAPVPKPAAEAPAKRRSPAPAIAIAAGSVAAAAILLIGGLQLFNRPTPTPTVPPAVGAGASAPGDEPAASPETPSPSASVETLPPEPAVTPNGTETVSTGTDTASVPTEEPFAPPYRRRDWEGRYSKWVAYAQQKLQEKDYGITKVDGLYGPETEKAVIQYKNDHFIPYTSETRGDLDKQTFDMIVDSTGTPTPKPPEGGPTTVPPGELLPTPPPSPAPTPVDGSVSQALTSGAGQDGAEDEELYLTLTRQP